VGGKGGGGGRGEKWTKPCMHIWIIKEKWKRKRKRKEGKFKKKISGVSPYNDHFDNYVSHFWEWCSMTKPHPLIPII
jgi:hypothetical protein